MAELDTTARIWDVATGQSLLTVTHQGAVSAVAFSPDGRWLATASADKTARISDAGTGRMLAELRHKRPSGPSRSALTATMWLLPANNPRKSGR